MKEIFCISYLQKKILRTRALFFFEQLNPTLVFLLLQSVYVRYHAIYS
jgi:hypothetical protein